MLMMPGDDVLIMPAGRRLEVFNFVGGTGHDVIADFSQAQGDLIRLSAADAVDFAALLSKISMQGADAVITLGSETIVLSGVAANSLTASDFLFA